MRNAILIFVGCGTGGLLRFWFSNFIYTLLGRSFPFGTLAVNVSGAFLMGFFVIVAQEKFSVIETPLRALLIAGLLGGYTTFSAFSFETFYLIESGNYLNASLNIILSITLCLFGVWSGVFLGRQL